MELHPATVHFPIALLITTGIVWGIYLYYQKMFFKEMAFWLHTFGLIAVGLAILTGNLEIPIDIAKEGQDILYTHEILGYVIGWLFLMEWIWLYFRKNIMKKIETRLFAAIFILSLSFVIWTSWLGGKLVYEYGAGVN